MSAAVTAASLAYAESSDIADRIQGSSVSTPSTPGSGTPTDPTLVGYGLWQITPGSTADYDPTVNAKIAVEKYQGSLAAGGGGWSPWTTYGTAAYYAAIPAAQAAYTQLTAPGATGTTVDVSNPLTPHAAAAASAATATNAADTTTSSAATQISSTTADQYITTLSGHNDAQYAIVQPNGTVLAQHEDASTVAVGQSADALLLLAYLRAHPAGTPTGAATSHLKAMIERSSASAATWVYGHVGPGAVSQIASLAHMTAFHLDSAAGGRAVGHSTATAKDLALLLANVDTLMPTAVRSYGMGLFDHASSGNQWGLLDANISTVNASAGGGVLAGDSTWTVSQAAQVKTDQHGVVGIAVTSTKSQSQSDGQDVIQTVGLDLLGAARHHPRHQHRPFRAVRQRARSAHQRRLAAAEHRRVPLPQLGFDRGFDEPDPWRDGRRQRVRRAAQARGGKTYEVGATQYGGPKDPSSSSYGSIGGSQGYLPSYPDTFAELSVLSSNPANGGTFTFQDGNALNTLPYMTGLRVTSGGKQKILYKRDIGYGQGPGQTIANGQPYRLDVWWQSAARAQRLKGPGEDRARAVVGHLGHARAGPRPRARLLAVPDLDRVAGRAAADPGRDRPDPPRRLRVRAPGCSAGGQGSRSRPPTRSAPSPTASTPTGTPCTTARSRRRGPPMTARAPRPTCSTRPVCTTSTPRCRATLRTGVTPVPANGSRSTPTPNTSSPSSPAARLTPPTTAAPTFPPARARAGAQTRSATCRTASPTSCATHQDSEPMTPAHLTRILTATLAIVAAVALAGCGLSNPNQAALRSVSTTPAASARTTTTAAADSQDPPGERGGTIPKSAQAAQETLAAGAGRATPSAALSATPRST